MLIFSFVFLSLSILSVILFAYHYTVGLIATSCIDKEYAGILYERREWNYVDFYMTFPKDICIEFITAIEYFKYSGGFLALAGVCWLGSLHFLT